MEDKNKDKKPNMPKFNMTWVYVTILIALALLYFTNNGEGQTGGNGGIAQKDNYSNFKEWVMKGAAEEVVVNNEEKELRMYVKPEFIQEIFKADVKQTGKSPYLEVEFGSEEKLEEFLDEAKEKGKFNGHLSYKNEKSGDTFNTFLSDPTDGC